MDDLHCFFYMAKKHFTAIMLNDQLTENKTNKTMYPIIAAIQQTIKGIYIIVTSRPVVLKVWYAGESQN